MRRRDSEACWLLYQVGARKLRKEDEVVGNTWVMAFKRERSAICYTRNP